MPNDSVFHRIYIEEGKINLLTSLPPKPLLKKYDQSSHHLRKQGM